jgi:hypothetical protein
MGSIARPAHPQPTGDPIGDIDVLLLQLTAAHLNRRRTAFVSFFLRFSDRQSWEQAACSGDLAGWQVSSFSKRDGLLLRVSRSFRPTVATLRRSRDFVAEFAHTHGAVWESISFEDPATESEWDRFVNEHCPPVERPVADSSSPKPPAKAARRGEPVVPIPRQRRASPDLPAARASGSQS